MRQLAKKSANLLLYASLAINLWFVTQRFYTQLAHSLDDEDSLEMGRMLHYDSSRPETTAIRPGGDQCTQSYGNGTCQDNYPNHHGQRLTHIVIPFHTSQVSRVEANLRLWQTYPPCSRAGAPPHPNAPYHLVLYSSADSKKRTYIADLEARLQSAVANLTSEALGCFQSVEIQHANLSGSSDTYYKGTRLMIEKLIVGKVKLQFPAEYVFYMEPDCLPIRSNWLNALDTSVRWPQPTFWMKGSIYRGYNKGVYATRHPPQFFHINGNAIYNVGDRQFRAWYIRHYRPYVQAATPRKDRSFDTDFWRFLYDVENIMVARQVIHKFVYTELVVNYWKSSYSVAKLRESFPNTHLVHGGYQKP